MRSAFKYMHLDFIVVEAQRPQSFTGAKEMALGALLLRSTAADLGDPAEDPGGRGHVAASDAPWREWRGSKWPRNLRPLQVCQAPAPSFGS